MKTFIIVLFFVILGLMQLEDYLQNRDIDKQQIKLDNIEQRLDSLIDAFEKE